MLSGGGTMCACPVLPFPWTCFQTFSETGHWTGWLTVISLWALGLLQIFLHKSHHFCYFFCSTDNLQLHSNYHTELKQGKYHTRITSSLAPALWWDTWDKVQPTQAQKLFSVFCCHSAFTEIVWNGTKTSWQLHIALHAKCKNSFHETWKALVVHFKQEGGEILLLVTDGDCIHLMPGHLHMKSQCLLFQL